MLPFYENHNQSVQFHRGTKLQFPVHIHRQIELFCLIDGENTIDISGVEHTMSGEEIAIAFPNEPHSYCGGNENVKYLNFIFDPDFCPDFSSVFRHYRPEFPFLKLEDAAPDLKETILLLYRTTESEQPDPRLAKGYLTIILYRIMEQLPLLSEAKAEKRDLTARVISYLMNHYQSGLSLGEVAEALGVSKYEVSRVFSKHIKMSFNQYLNRMRLEQAIYLLTSTEQSVTDIAFSCGFESLRTFYRAFSEQYHLSPLTYRQTYFNQMNQQ